MAFPKKTKIIDGKLYKLRFRFPVKKIAEESAKYQRAVHSSRIGYSIKVVELPPDQWGMVDWDKKKYATYEFLGFPSREITGGLASLFE